MFVTGLSSVLAYVSPYMVFTEVLSVPVHALLSPDYCQLYLGVSISEEIFCLH